jgi:putative glycosyltransferase (TIGR04372 family)
MNLSQRIRRVRALGLRKTLILRRIRSLRHRGHIANEQGQSDLAVVTWEKMMRLQRKSPIRYLRSYDWTNGIGHNAFLDFFIKRKLFGLHHAEYTVIVDPAYIANRFYLSLWRKHFRFVIEKPPIDIELYEDWPMLVELDGEYVEIHKALTRMNQLWGSRPPVIEFPPELVESGYNWSTLRHHGWSPHNGWFVTFHLRHGEPQYDSVRNIRNPQSYQKAVDLINAAGGRVVLMGMKGADFGLKNVIDKRGASNWQDIFLISQCRFFVGSNSGPGVVAGTFGKPLIIANYAPSGLPYPYPAITVPKLITRKGAPVSADDPSYLRLWTTTQLAARGLEIHDNTADEIAEAVGRMLHETHCIGLRRGTPDLRLVPVGKGNAAQGF